jgi:hypothetical protein
MIMEIGSENNSVVNFLNELPDDPSRITFSGRYPQADKALSELMTEKLAKGEKFKILDFASGILLHGSPTATDLADEIQSKGGKPFIVAVDNYQPEGFTPNDPRIEYSTEIPPRENNFDSVRMFHLHEHVDYLEYEKIKKSIIEKLREGGFFITTQYFTETYGLRDTYGGEKHKSFGQIIKILQKREGELKLVSLIPDSNLGYQFNMLTLLDKNNYSKFREEVMAGKTQLDRSPMINEFNVIINRLLNCGDVEKIDEGLTGGEMLNFSRDENYRFDVSSSDSGREYLEKLEQRKVEAKKYFDHPKRKTLLGWRY